MTENTTDTRIAANRITLDPASVKLSGTTPEEQRSTVDIDALGRLRERSRPIGITKDRKLIFGLDRLLHAQVSGHREIEAWVIPLERLAAGDYLDPYPFKLSELMAITLQVYDKLTAAGYRNPGIEERFAGRKRHISNVVASMREEVAANRSAGISRTQIQRIRGVCRDAIPELIVAMDEKRISPDPAFRYRLQPRDEQLAVATGQKKPDIEDPNLKTRRVKRPPRGLRHSPVAQLLETIYKQMETARRAVEIQQMPNGKPAVSDGREIDVKYISGKLKLAKNLVQQARQALS